MTDAILEFIERSLQGSPEHAGGSKEKDECGSRCGTGAAKINHFVLYEMEAPMRAVEIADVLQEKRVRVRRHIDWLQKYATDAPQIIKYSDFRWGRPGLETLGRD